MSRIGNRIISIPEGTTASLEGNKLTVKGKEGTLSREFSPLIAIEIKENTIATTRANEIKHTKQLHGTTNSLIFGMVEGVTNGFKKEIEIKGVGYKAIVQGTKITVHAGYSHPHVLDIIEGVKVDAPKPTIVNISGPDKQKVGQMAALIRNIRRPSPYSGKGIMYKNEHIIRKEGKSAK